MKYTITINQYAVFINGLINKTDCVDWVIIDYLKDFSIYKKAKKIVYKNEEYIWLNYNHLIASLPLTKLKYKPKVTARISKLRDLGLIKTVKNKDNTLFYTFTERLIDICFTKSTDIDRLRKNVGQGFSLATDKSKPTTETGSFREGLPYSATSATSAVRIQPLAQNVTPPVTNSVTPPVTKTVTAQYKTKISILNKDNNNDISFSSSFSKNKKDYHASEAMRSTSTKIHENTKKECFYKETRKIGDFFFLDSWSLYKFFSCFLSFRAFPPQPNKNRLFRDSFFIP